MNITDLKAVVLDEADEMLDLGFREDLEFILEATPAERRTLLFSATMPKIIANLAKRYQRNALRIEASGGERAHADIEYRAMRVAPNEVEHAVVNVLRFVEAQSTIVFCNTRDHVRHLHATLLERGFAAVYLSGELSQGERNHALQALRDGRARVCVATDVAARGIDLPNLGLVIHADLPNDAEILQHRSGRTGRAGKKGVSVVLVPLSRRRKAEQMLAAAKVNPVWSGPPQAEDIRKLDQQRMLHDPLLTEISSEEDLEMARAVLAMRSPEEIAAALVRVYRARLPAAEDVFDPGPGREFREAKPARRDAHSSEPRNFTWFRLDIGRKNNADPKWLLPMICRRGKVVKADIGAIRITDNETRFEIANAVVERFTIASLVADDEDVKIELLKGAPEISRPSRNPDRKPNFMPKHEAEPQRYEDRKPHEGAAKPKFEGTGYKGKKPFGGGDKPGLKARATRARNPSPAASQNLKAPENLTLRVTRRPSRKKRPPGKRRSGESLSSPGQKACHGSEDDRLNSQSACANSVSSPGQSASAVRAPRLSTFRSGSQSISDSSRLLRKIRRTCQPDPAACGSRGTFPVPLGTRPWPTATRWSKTKHSPCHLLCSFGTSSRYLRMPPFR